MPYSDLDEEEIHEAKRGIALMIGSIVLAIIIYVLAGCTYADKDRVVFLGGKGAYKSKVFALTTDNEKSFNDLAILGLAAVPAVQAVKVAQSADKLSAIESTNAANVTNTAAKLHTQEVINGQNTALDTVKATTLPK